MSARLSELVKALQWTGSATEKTVHIDSGAGPVHMKVSQNRDGSLWVDGIGKPGQADADEADHDYIGQVGTSRLRKLKREVEALPWHSPVTKWQGYRATGAQPGRIVEVRPETLHVLHQALRKALGESVGFHVELDKAALKQMDGLGHEEQRRAQKLIDKVHGHPMHEPHPAISRLTEPQLRAIGLPHTSRNHFTVGDYRVRMMAELQGNKLRIFDVRTREDSKHSGRTRR